MRGNDRVLFVGNMSCLSPAVNDQRDPTKIGMECMWSTKRVVVSDTSILFFAHASSDVLPRVVGPPLNDMFDDFTQHLTTNTNKVPKTIPMMQERLNAHKASLVNDPDSITSAPIRTKLAVNNDSDPPNEHKIRAAHLDREYVGGVHQDRHDRAHTLQCGSWSGHRQQGDQSIHS